MISFFRRLFNSKVEEGYYYINPHVICYVDWSEGGYVKYRYWLDWRLGQWSEDDHIESRRAFNLIMRPLPPHLKELFKVKDRYI